MRLFKPKKQTIDDLNTKGIQDFIKTHNLASDISKDATELLNFGKYADPIDLTALDYAQQLTYRQTVRTVLNAYIQALYIKHENHKRHETTSDLNVSTNLMKKSDEDLFKMMEIVNSRIHHLVKELHTKRSANKKWEEISLSISQLIDVLDRFSHGGIGETSGFPWIKTKISGHPLDKHFYMLQNGRYNVTEKSGSTGYYAIRSDFDAIDNKRPLSKIKIVSELGIHTFDLNNLAYLRLVPGNIFEIISDVPVILAEATLGGRYGGDIAHEYLSDCVMAPGIYKIGEDFPKGVFRYLTQSNTTSVSILQLTADRGIIHINPRVLNDDKDSSFVSFMTEILIKKNISHVFSLANGDFLKISRPVVVKKGVITVAGQSQLKILGQTHGLLYNPSSKTETV